MNNFLIFGALILATALEATGDAIVRIGLAQDRWLVRGALFLAGAALLFGYGLFVNLAPAEFGRVVGLYVATLFVVWQIVNFIAFRAAPSAPVLIGGVLIVVGGLVVTLWRSA